jgi:hypothetical protein
MSGNYKSLIAPVKIGVGIQMCLMELDTIGVENTCV